MLNLRPYEDREKQPLPCRIDWTGGFPSIAMVDGYDEVLFHVIGIGEDGIIFRDVIPQDIADAAGIQLDDEGRIKMGE